MTTRQHDPEVLVGEALRKALAGARVDVKLALHGSGSELQPEAEVFFPKGTHVRQRNASLLLLAARVELLTPVQEHWLVETEVLGDGNSGRVYVELLGVGGPRAFRDEAERALKVLRDAIG